MHDFLIDQIRGTVLIVLVLSLASNFHSCQVYVTGGNKR